MECVEYFMGLWQQRVGKDGHDLITMLANGEETKDMDTMEYLGNLILLIVGGNDTTRNSMSASIYGSNLFPAEWEKVRANRDLIPNTVAEIIRWQTPLAYMRRTALEDVEMHGKTIKKGDKVAMWYVSGNRDERKFKSKCWILTVPMRAIIFHSVSAFTVASATVWPNCNCKYCGMKCSSASQK